MSSLACRSPSLSILCCSDRLAFSSFFRCLREICRQVGTHDPYAVLMGGQQEIEEYEKGGAPWCITYTFLPDEMERILKSQGVKNIRLSGPGAYGRTVPREILLKIMEDPQQKADFLDFCYQFDSNPYVCGMGKDNLLAIGEI